MGNEKMSRRGFLKLGVAGIWAVSLLFLAGCLGGEEEDDDEGEEDD